MVDGYATILTLPLHMTMDTNDVRAEGSPVLSHYTLVALKGAPHDGSRKPFTQIRLSSMPLPPDRATGDLVLGGSAYPNAYHVPASEKSAFWVAGEFLVNASLLWSYSHTHPSWALESWLYVGATSTAMDMDSVLPGSNESLKVYSDSELEQARTALKQNAAAAGAQLVCHYVNNERLVEVQRVRAHSPC